MTTLIVRGTHTDGQPFEARLVGGNPTNDRDADNSVIVEVRHGTRVYRRRWSHWIQARTTLMRRCARLEDWNGPEYVQTVKTSR